MESEGELEYKMEMDRLLLLCSVVEDAPLDKMLATVERAESLGPIFFPSEFQVVYRELLAGASADVSPATLATGGRLDRAVKRADKRNEDHAD